ncbi:uncharacterized protein N7473_001718 [Penicillium subrubescens]|uniref:uncharacterized protein n=1 Tax=Penicillium subrubescens TaxID=1316194 RepID=UPI00254530EA|nr:uncharacterized protein N7473_001718 [Penicillium subrubescens]KAJ5904802.1 hypothetical protein N7473_001718 [Penicillium subrubescens]
MASASVIKQAVVPGLHVAPTEADLKQSSVLYNQLPSDEAQPPLLHNHSQEIREILLRHNVQDRIGIHLIHGHFQIPSDQVMLGHYFENPTGCWTKPVPIEEVDASNIHGHIFKLSRDGELVAYEYREGPPEDLSEINTSFFKDVFTYLLDHNLTDTFGLQALHHGPSSPMIELVLGNSGTVMLDEAQAQYGKVYRTTGWYVGNGSESKGLEDGEKHAQTTKGTHRVFVDEIPLSHIGELKGFLKKEEIIQ